ncbi:glycosyltransferase family 4 protein [Rodentibacter trehalosifermentans]|uniref:glycosyltransferase family 4 protein n=1 Tax=Rodentibacter trehalosifermentans TaxID=1908263 RepID=UPI0009843058|nr:glycosyltransferase family 4 protein [Rodentibacter trehalosifermentans]OOF51657.1 glycosyl transferase [Rodentibacter trehalosifermentans]
MNKQHRKVKLFSKENQHNPPPERVYVVNHVMSRDIPSGIFSAILSYFTQHGSQGFTHVISITPIPEADIYHYHRPHLETQLLPNSVCTVHHDLDDPDPWHAKFRFIPRYMESSAVVCLNNSQKEILIEQGISSNKCYVVPHGYHSSFLHLKKEKSLSDVKKITIGIASRRYGRRVKGDAYLLELAKRLDPDYFNFVFVGQDRTLSTIEMRKLGYSAVAYERLPYRLFQSFYEAIDVLLICSTHEGGPANAPEAIATGTPMFSTRLGIPKDTITDMQNGLFLTLNPDDDAEKIMDICVHNRSQMQKIMDNAREQTYLALTWEQSVSGNLAVYRNVIE